MQIAIEIRHEFGDVGAFATFAAKLQSLFAEFAAPSVTLAPAKKSAAPAIVDTDGPGAASPRTMRETPAAEQTVAIYKELPADATSVEVTEAFAGLTNSDTVTPTPSASGAAFAEPLSGVPVSEPVEDTPKRTRKPRAARATETPSALPTDGGPAGSASPPATAPSAPAAAPTSTAAGANATSASALNPKSQAFRRSFILKWIGRYGDDAYMEVFNKRLSDTIRRFGDLDEAGQCEVIAELRAVHPLTDAEVEA